MISAQSIEALNQCDMPTLVKDYAPDLRPSGSKKWQSRCPFHREKTASFTVYPDHFHCFGCGASGNALTFIMKAEGLSFPEAAKALAARLGVSLEETSLTGGQARHAAQEAEFCRWWWNTRAQAVIDAISQAVMDEDWDFAECCERIGRHFADVSVSDRYKIFERDATIEDRGRWREWQREDAERKEERAAWMDFLRKRLAIGTADAKRCGYKDPDDFIRMYGAAAYGKCLNRGIEVPW